MKRLIVPALNYLYTFWNQLISIGIKSEEEPEEHKYVRFTNVVALLTAAVIISYIPYTLFKGYYYLSLLQVTDTLFVLMALWLNHQHQYKMARHVFILVINLFVLINSCIIGFESRVHDFFYISYVVPFLLFSIKDYKNIIAGVLAAVVSFIIYHQIYPLFTTFNLDVATQLNIYQINIWMKFVLFGIAAYILVYYNYTGEKELALSNKKLKEQASKLKRSNEDLEQFAYVISHDLKSPVRNISSFMKLLLSRYGTSFVGDAHEFMEHSRVSAERLTRQIDDLLDYSRVGRNLPPAASVDTAHLIKTIEAELSGKIKERNVHIIVSKHFPVLHNLHSGMIYHVFRHLIDNAIKFNTGKSVEIILDYKETNELFTFSVIDNGIGIEPQYSTKLFQLFKRLHNADQYDGTGIGLAVAKKAVNFYNGTIWFESEPGKGTTFFFTLPKNSSVKTAQIADGALELTPVLKAA